MAVLFHFSVTMLHAFPCSQQARAGRGWFGSWVTHIRPIGIVRYEKLFYPFGTLDSLG
jgi:hypothetical protein